MEPTILATRIQARLDAIGRSARDVSLEISGNAEAVRNILRGKSKQPHLSTLEKLAVELGTSVDYLLGRADDPDAGTSRAAPAVAKRLNQTLRTEFRGVEVPGTPIGFMPNDIPVMGTAAASAIGSFQFEGGVIDYVRRPPALANTRDIYAILVEGPSMIPEHRPGDLRFVSPHRPARIGDTVIVQVKSFENDGPAALIGHLLRRAGGRLSLGKLNPESTVEIPLDTIISIHRVLTMNELFGF